MPDSLHSVTSENFKQHLHTTFRVQGGNQPPIALELIAVEEPGSAPGTDLFCLHFRGPRSQRLAQKIWSLEHEKMGTLDLFITAIGADENGVIYEAVFHRLRKSGTDGRA